jgi:excisionase family DNA binding protein
VIEWPLMPSGGCVALPTLYTPEEVAEKLRVSRRAVYQWLNSGKLDGLKAGQHWRVAEEDLTQFLKRHRHQVHETHSGERA